MGVGVGTGVGLGLSAGTTVGAAVAEIFPVGGKGVGEGLSATGGGVTGCHKDRDVDAAGAVAGLGVGLGLAEGRAVCSGTAVGVSQLRAQADKQRHRLRSRIAFLLGECGSEAIIARGNTGAAGIVIDPGRQPMAGRIHSQSGIALPGAVGEVDLFFQRQR